MPDLAARLESGEIKQMQPFGRALHHSMTHARRASEEVAIWEEEDYCRPPLAQERQAVLDDYFQAIEVELVEPGEGWQKIESLPSVWAESPPG
jgi:hypothetical protein